MPRYFPSILSWQIILAPSQLLQAANDLQVGFGSPVYVLHFSQAHRLVQRGSCDSVPRIWLAKAYRGGGYLKAHEQLHIAYLVLGTK